MGGPDRRQVVRECFGAYESGDRAVLERHVSEDFRFSSPIDVDLDRAGYFERCWPNARALAAFRFRRLAEVGEEVLVTYECTRADGRRFCNTELFTFEGERVRAVEVYFGWDLD